MTTPAFCAVVMTAPYVSCLPVMPCAKSLKLDRKELSEVKIAITVEKSKPTIVMVKTMAWRRIQDRQPVKTAKAKQ